MQFEIHVGTDYSTVKFPINKLHYDANLNLGVILCRLGGEMKGDFSWKFPSFITKQVLEEVIHNTCFVCGGLMQDEEYHSDHILRKCSSCGHSHT